MIFLGFFSSCFWTIYLFSFYSGYFLILLFNSRHSLVLKNFTSYLLLGPLGTYYTSEFY